MTRLILVVAAVTLMAASPPLHLSGNWTFRTAGDPGGKMQLTQSGTHVIMKLTWTPNPQPAPHYIVNAILSGRVLSGTWQCLAAICHHGRGRFHAIVSSSGARIVVSGTQDPGNANQWNSVVLTRK